MTGTPLCKTVAIEWQRGLGLVLKESGLPHSQDVPTVLCSTSIGLDVHARSISAAAFVFETGKVMQRTFGYDPVTVAAWAASLPQPAGCLYKSVPWIGNPYLVLKSTPDLPIWARFLHQPGQYRSASTGNGVSRNRCLRPPSRGCLQAGPWSL